MKAWIPGTSRNLRRSDSTTFFIGSRSARGFRLMNRRPVFCEPCPPLKEFTVATLGSLRRMSARRACSCTMAGNEVSSEASVVMRI